MNKLQENMKRFGTKNLKESDLDSNNNGYPDESENISDEDVNGDSMCMTDDEYVASESSPLPDMDKVLFDYAKRSDVDKKEFILLLKDHIKHLTKEFENTSYLP